MSCSFQLISLHIDEMPGPQRASQHQYVGTYNYSIIVGTAVWASYTAVSHLAGVDADMDCGSVGLLPLHTLDVDDVFLPVDLHHFANLLAFVVSTDHLSNNTHTHSKSHICTFHASYDKLSNNLSYSTWTSSSLRMGMDLTLYFWRSSLDRGEDMIFLLMCEGALKCLLRFLRREEVTNGLSFMMLRGTIQKGVTSQVKATR